MAKCGVTRREYEEMIDSLIAREVAEAARNDQLAAVETGKAEAYSNVQSHYSYRSWSYGYDSVGPSASCQQAAAVNRENARVYRERAQQHLSKAAEYRVQRAQCLAAGGFDPEH